MEAAALSTTAAVSSGSGWLEEPRPKQADGPEPALQARGRSHKPKLAGSHVRTRSAGPLRLANLCALVLSQLVDEDERPAVLLGPRQGRRCPTNPRRSR